MIFPCLCKNEYQDKRYGKGKRVGNIVDGAVSSRIVLRCTSCKAEYYTKIKGRPAKKAGERKTRFWFDSPEKTRERFSTRSTRRF
jgi:hypothetical protein